MTNELLIVQFDGYSVKEEKFAHCIIIIKESIFNISKAYNISKTNNYLICSDIKVNYFKETDIEQLDSEYRISINNAQNIGNAFLCVGDDSNQNMNHYRVPRFSESDFEEIINRLGGIKIPETNIKTPDFILKNILLELKDLQKESLFHPDRQKALAELFNDYTGYAINIDPSLNYGELTKKYHRLIANTIKNYFMSASKQIRTHKKSNEIDGAGVIILNTGMYSLPHELFKTMVQEILQRDTNTIEFALVFSQKMQTNGWDMNAVIFTDWVGNVPEKIVKVKKQVGNYVDKKMTEMMKLNNNSISIESQHPISFEINNKVFYWNPGQLRFPWESRKEV